jgi:nitrous oxidase accessory protein NosD
VSMARVGLTLAAAATGLLLLIGATATATTAAVCRVSNLAAHREYNTLQAAVNAASPGDTLKVSGTCQGDTTISESLTIVGDSGSRSGPATLDGDNSEQSPGTVVTVTAGFTVAMRGLTVEGGNILDHGSGNAGGILNEGSLTITHSSVTGNGATFGGGIVHDGSLMLEASTLTGNRATGHPSTAAGSSMTNRAARPSSTRTDGPGA